MRIRRWIGFVSLRWFATKRESGGSASALLAASGIAIGVAALVIVLGVMNGFQLGYIESILEVSSFHVRIEDEGAVSGALPAAPDDALIARIAALPGAASVLPFIETRCLISSPEGRTFPLALRAVPDDAPLRDPRMMRALGPKGWPGQGGFFLGAELAEYLGVTEGSVVNILVISAGGEEGIDARAVKIQVDGLFRSGYYDFDFGMAIMPFSAALPLFPAGEPRRFVYGIKLRDRDSDMVFRERLEAELGIGPDRAQGWRDYNRVFFGALRIEKTVMMILVGLIFLVVGVNIFHSMRRAVAEKTEDIAVLKAMGASPDEIGRVFVLDGLAIGSGGALAGLVVGLLVAVNVNEVFAMAEAIVNGASALASAIAGSLGGEDFRIFSPQYFYLMEVPVRVLFPEVFFITAAAIAAAAAAAAAAAKRITSLAPAEVLRYE